MSFILTGRPFYQFDVIPNERGLRESHSKIALPTNRNQSSRAVFILPVLIASLFNIPRQITSMRSELFQVRAIDAIEHVLIY